jgi:hypothetical protein
MAKSMKPGGGGRFAKLKGKLQAKGKSAASAGAIAASIGRKKYGAKKFAKMAHHGKMRSHGKIGGLGGEVRRPSTRSHHQGKSFAENMSGKKY